MYFFENRLIFTTKKTKISEGYLVREDVKSLSNSVTKFCDQGICDEFHFIRHYFPSLILLFLIVFVDNDVFVLQLFLEIKLDYLLINEYFSLSFRLLATVIIWTKLNSEH